MQIPRRGDVMLTSTGKRYVVGRRVREKVTDERGGKVLGKRTVGFRLWSAKHQLLMNRVYTKTDIEDGLLVPTGEKVDMAADDADEAAARGEEVDDGSEE